MQPLDRRLFVAGVLGAGLPGVATSGLKNEDVFRFATAEWDIRLTVEYLDHYSSNGFVFDERLSNNQFCLSGKGEQGRNCVTAFVGSLAIARYHFKPRARTAAGAALREFVRTIDEDSGQPVPVPFERTLELAGGVVSDIQAFGYQGEKPSSEGRQPWRLLRQDLYIAEQPYPFLVIHWKHTLNAIRLLDVIPGEHTWTR